MEITSSPWLLVTVLGVALLAIAIIYGMMRNGERSRRDRRVTEAATHAQYKREG